MRHCGFTRMQFRNFLYGKANSDAELLITDHSFINDVTQFWSFFDPFPSPPHCHAFYYWGLSAVVTKSLTPSPLDCDVVYGIPLRDRWEYGERRYLYLNETWFACSWEEVRSLKRIGEIVSSVLLLEIAFRRTCWFVKRFIGSLLGHSAHFFNLQWWQSWKKKFPRKRDNNTFKIIDRASPQVIVIAV